MSNDEIRETMIRVGSHAAMAASVSIGGCTDGFDHDPEQVERILVDALFILLDETDGHPEDTDGTRGDLLSIVRARKAALE